MNAIYPKSQDFSHHAWFHHNDACGYIAVAKKTPNGFEQHHYRPEDLASQLSEWLGEDVYFSQNTFYKPQRKIENIRELRSLYVDLDCYLLNLDPNWLLGHLETVYFNEQVPRPNYIIFSGQGLNVIWLLEPVPHKALPLWQVVQNHFVKQLSKLGADAKASDAARIFRIAGSVNSKNQSVVEVAYLHENKFKLRDIQAEYLPQLTPGKKKRGRPAKVVHVFKEYSLFHARLGDLLKLCELRRWNMTGFRELTLFLYRYWSCCYLSDPQSALDATEELNNRFTAPLGNNEVVKATRSAEKVYLDKEKAYRYSNKKLIEVLDITEDEQRHLSTIIGTRVKYDRNNERRTKTRREAGSVSRDEYLSKANERRAEARRLREQGLSYRKIAQALNCSVGEAHRLLNE